MIAFHWGVIGDAETTVRLGGVYVSNFVKTGIRGPGPRPGPRPGPGQGAGGPSADRHVGGVVRFMGERPDAGPGGDP